MAASPVGRLVVGVTDQGAICRLSFVSGAVGDDIALWQAEWPQCVFTRTAKVMDLRDQKIVLVGTAFQHTVWRAIAAIPAGQVATYGDIARRINNPKAVRAVGTACGANPVPYLIPCHRVVAANGLGGFSSGLDLKKKLLTAEGYRVSDKDTDREG